MSQKEIITVLKVNTENSGNNIKSLKQEIAQLKKTLESAEIGSEEFAKASNDLATAQANLKTILADGKKTIDAAEGSYNHMVATMAELKKQWRATADEAKRNEIGKQIDAINTKLKDMDSTIGNHQRNVGNYKGDIIEAYDEMGIGVKSYGEKLADAQKSTEATRGTLDGVSKMASGIAGGFAAAQGVISLLGVESENLDKAMVKLMATMSVAQNIGKFKDLIEGFNQLKSGMIGADMASQAMTTSTTAMSGAMGGATTATGTLTKALGVLKAAIPYAALGTFIAGVFGLIGNMDTLKNRFRNVSAEEKEKKALADLNVELSKNFSQSAAKTISRILELKREFNNLGNDLDAKKKFVIQYKDELANMGIEMNDVNDAEKIFRDKTQDYINAVMARAKADALREKAAKDYASYLETRAILEQDLADAESKKASGTPDKTFWENIGEVLIGASVNEGAPVDVVQDFNDAWTDEIAQDAVDAAQKKLDDAETEINAKMDKLFKEADKEDEKANEYLKKTPTGGTTGGGSGGGSGSSGNKEKTQAEIDAENLAKKLEEIQNRAAEYIEQHRLSLLDSAEEEIAELTSKYEEEKKLFKGKEEELTRLKNEYDIKKSEITKKYQEKEREELLKTLDTHLSAIETTASYNEQTTNAKFDEKSLALDENDAVGAIQLEIDKTLELQDIRKRAFEAQMTQIIAVLDAEKERDLLTAEQEAELQKQYNAIQQEKVLATAEATNQINALNKQMIEQQKADNRELAQNITTTFTSALNATSNILSALQEGLDTTKKDDFEKNKKYQKAQVGISTALGIINAFATSNALPQPFGMILAGINAATVAAVGAIQMSNINKQQFDKPVETSDTGVGVSPNISMADMIPINYTKDILTDTETAELNKGNRVYVVESDITETQNDVAVKETNSTF